MTLSLNETEALAKKAARGAGYPWGIAEETGKAVRWLCAAGLDGCAALARYLLEVEENHMSASAAVTGQNNVWVPKGDRLCPLLAGAALSDLADTLKGREIRLENVAHPILLTPFAGLSALHLRDTLSLEWSSARVATDGKAVVLDGQTDASKATVTAYLGAGFDPALQQPTCSRANPDDATRAILNRFAHRTYAPATEASRLSGAGAGLSDND